MPLATNRPINRKIVLARYVTGMVSPEDFRLEEELAREPDEGEVMVQVDTLSIDAFIRTSLNAQEGLHQQVPLGGPVVALGVGRVIDSRAAGFAVGDAVSGPLCAQTHATLPGSMLQKIDPGLPLSTYLGVLGLTSGVTAYFGALAVAEVRAGETVLVSGAAGAVGVMVGQIAKIAGARVIGMAGGPEKCAILTQTLGFDEAIDYKNEDVNGRLKALAPKGVDVFFDNVGGPLLDTALDNLAEGARVVICGAISQYNDQQNVRGPSLYLRLAERNARMLGFTVMHYAARYGEAFAQLAQWLAEGRLTMPEQVETGIDRFPTALRKLFEGGNTGKMLVKP